MEKIKNNTCKVMEECGRVLVRDVALLIVEVGVRLVHVHNGIHYTRRVKVRRPYRGDLAGMFRPFEVCLL